MRSVLIIVNVIALILPSFVFAESRTQRAYIRSGEGGHEEILYKNSAYFRCQTKAKCKKTEAKPGAEHKPPAKIAIFLKSHEGKQIIPTFMQCHETGTSTVTMAEDLIPVFNQAVKEENPDCINLSSITDPVSSKLAAQTLEAMKGLENGCPKEDRSCAGQIVDLFEKDLKNALDFFSWRRKAEGESVQIGCLSNILANVIESLKTTVKLFLWDIPKAGWGLAKSSWNYFFGEEEETTGAMVLASVMPEDMAEAVSNLDFAKLYQIVRKNFFSFLGNIRTFYGELLGCTEWEGSPFESECLKKTNWSCPTCESVTNFACGLAGQLGTGFLLGGILGTAKSLASMSKYRKQVASQPQKFGLTQAAIEEMGAKEVIAKGVEKGRYAKHMAVQAVRPVSNMLRTATDEAKLLFGMGSSFQKLVQNNPVTLPYHLSYQAGKNRAFRAMHNRMLEKSGGTGIHLSKKYAFHLESIQSEFGKNILAMKNIAGDKFHPRIYNDLMARYVTKIEAEMGKIGVKTSRIDGPDGTVGIRLEKGGESFDYVPKFQEKLKNSGNLDNDALKAILTHDDPILGGANAYADAASVGPKFLKEMQERARDTKNLYAIKPDGKDGMVYLGHFISQEGSVPRSEDCDRFLDGYDSFQTHDITNEDAFMD